MYKTMIDKDRSPVYDAERKLCTLIPQRKDKMNEGCIGAF